MSRALPAPIPASRSPPGEPFPSRQTPQSSETDERRKKTMKVRRTVKITRSPVFDPAKNPPSTETAIKAMEEIGGEVISAEEKQDRKESYTQVDFYPPRTGNYKTTYPVALAKLVKGAKPQSWDFDWPEP